jgi:hypothetical protein
MLGNELKVELGYEPYEASGRNPGNCRNGHYGKKVRTSDGDVETKVRRERSLKPQTSRVAGIANREVCCGRERARTSEPHGCEPCALTN